MCRVRLEARDNFRAWLVPVVTGTAEGNQVSRFIGRLDAPRNDVVHVHQFPGASEVGGQLSAVFASVLVALPYGRRNPLPVLTAPVVSGRAALPSGALRPRLRPGAGRDIARVAAIGARGALGKREARPAVGANCVLRSNSIPSAPVVTRHIAEPARSSLVGECLKLNPAAFAYFLNTGAGFPFATAHPPVPGWASVRAGAVARAVFSPRWPGERSAAFGAGVKDRFHEPNIAGISMGINDFEIACRRVEEATRQPDLFIAPPEAPTQETLL